MENAQSQLDALCRLLEEEVASYRSLVQEMNNESECLKRGSTEALIGVVRSIEHHTDAVTKRRKVIQGTLEKALVLSGKGGEEKTFSNLMPLLSLSDRKKIQDHQRTIIGLQGRLAKANDRNKAFMEETLAQVKGLISLLISPSESCQGYVRNGKRESSPPLPYSLNREI